MRRAAGEEREDRGRALESSPIDPMEMARLSQSMVAASPGLSQDVRDLITAARQAVDGERAVPTGIGGGAAGVAPAHSEPVYVPRWQAPDLARCGGS